ncbi:hypothetical protein [Azospirillum endophyticum]
MVLTDSIVSILQCYRNVHRGFLLSNGGRDGQFHNLGLPLINDSPALST